VVHGIGISLELAHDEDPEYYQHPHGGELGLLEHLLTARTAVMVVVILVMVAYWYS
jgi:hypothetical protein